MEKTAKSANRFMLFFMIHNIVISTLVFLTLSMTGREYDMYTLQTFGSLLVFLPPLVLYVINSRAKLKDIFYLRPLGIINFFLIIATTFAVQPLLLFLSGLSAIFFPNNVSDYISSFFSVPLWAVITTTSVLPAILEESLFRGVIFDKNSSLPISRKVLLSAFFFAIMHLDPQQFLYTFVAGIIFAYLMYITRSILAPILAHFTLNATQTMILNYSLQAGEIVEATEVQVITSLIYSAILLVFTLPFLVFAVYLLLINNRDKIAFDSLVSRLKKIAERQTWREKEKTAVKTVSEETAGISKSGNRFKRVIFTWEFWGVILIYVVYVTYFSIYS